MKKLFEVEEKKISGIPPQYQGLPLDVVKMLLESGTRYSEPVKDKQEQERRKGIVRDVRQLENERELEKKRKIQERYKSLDTQSKIKFGSLQGEIVEVLVSKYVVGDEELDQLYPEERFLVVAIRDQLLAQKERNPTDNFTPNLSDIQKEVYTHWVQRLTLEGIEDEDTFHGGTSDDKSNKNTSKSLDNSQGVENGDESILDAYSSVYWNRRGHLYEDMFLVSHGIDPDRGEKFYELVDGDVGKNYDAHGISKINQLEHLLDLLENGVDTSRQFSTAPFELSEGERITGSVSGTSSGTAYKDGIAVLVGGYKHPILEKNGVIMESKIEIVFINDIFATLVNPLRKKFPQYQIYLLSEQKRVLRNNAQNI